MEAAASFIGLVLILGLAYFATTIVWGECLQDHSWLYCAVSLR